MAFDDGFKVVAAAGTREPLSANTSVVGWLTVIALPSNTSLITVGDVNTVAATGSTYRGVGLAANEWITLEHVTLSNIFLDSRVSGEGVTYLFGG